MVDFIPELVAAARTKGMPPQLIQALANDISGGRAKLECAAPETKHKVQLAVNITRMYPQEIFDVLSVDRQHICNFEVDADLFRKNSRVFSSMSSKEVFLFSCKIGLFMHSVHDLVFAGRMKSHAIAGESHLWMTDLRAFMKNVSEQVDLFLFDLENLSGKELLLGISKYYCPHTSFVTNKTHQLIKNAKALDLSWEFYLDDERREQQREASKLRGQIEKTVRPGTKQPKDAN